MQNIQQICQTLYDKFGPQGWWPLIRNSSVVHNARFTNKKLTSKEQFEITIGAILTQNTAWTNVEKALLVLHKNKALTKATMQKMPKEKLASLIRPAGYYNQKARKLKGLIKFLNSKKAVTRENLLNIWGIGPETADSILCYVYNQPVFVVDAYTKRIFSKLGFAELEYEQLQGLVHKNLTPENYKEFHALLVKLGKEYCKKNKPKCSVCPINKPCAHPIRYNHT